MICEFAVLLTVQCLCVAGASGFTGSQGARGERGPAGLFGSRGSVGIQGAVGVTGASGPTGEKGFRGPRGDTGPDGPVGSQGRTGNAGLPGQVGPNGDTGASGQTGAPHDVLLLCTRRFHLSTLFCLSNNWRYTVVVSAARRCVQLILKLLQSDSATLSAVIVISEEVKHMIFLNMLQGTRHECIFYRAMLCIRGTSHDPVSVRLTVCLSVTSRCSIETAERIELLFGM